MKNPKRILFLVTAFMMAFLISGTILSGLAVDPVAAIVSLNPLWIIAGAGVLFVLGRVFKAKPGHAYDGLVISDTTFAGTFAPFYTLPAIYDLDTIDKKIVYVIDGIKDKVTVGAMNVTAPLQPRNETPTSSGQITVTGQLLAPQNIMAYTEFNPRDLETYWEAGKEGALSEMLLDRQLPVTFENYLLSVYTGYCFEGVEQNFWIGSTNYSTLPSTDARYQYQFFDGFIKLFVNDANVYKTSSVVTFTNANIGTYLADLETAAATNNKALMSKATRYSRMQFTMSVASGVLFQQFLTNNAFKNQNTTDAGLWKFHGYTVNVVAGMADNTIVFTESVPDTTGNLWVGMNSVSDENVLMNRLQPNSELFFIKILLKIAVQYGWSNKVFMATTLTANSFIP